LHDGNGERRQALSVRLELEGEWQTGGQFDDIRLD
jgi:hypothetical protein